MSELLFRIDPTQSRILVRESPAASSVSQKTTYRIRLQKDEEGRIVATCPDLQGVATDGKDEDEALDNAYDAVSAMLEALGRSAEEFNLIEDSTI